MLWSKSWKSRYVKNRLIIWNCCVINPVAFGGHDIFDNVLILREYMTKADIVEQIYEKVGFSKKESAELVERVFGLIKETLESGEKIKIAGFGNFVVKEKADRRGRNPQTGDEIIISARRILTFKPSQVLKSSINS